MNGITGGTGVVLVIGLTEIAKRVQFPNRWLPIFALAVGIIYGFFVEQNVVNGILYGLSGQGLYRGTKVSVLGE